MHFEPTSLAMRSEIKIQDIRIRDCKYCIPDFPLLSPNIVTPAVIVLLAPCRLFLVAVLLQNNIECAIDPSANSRVDLSKEDDPTIAGCSRFDNRTIGNSKNQTISDN